MIHAVWVTVLVLCGVGFVCFVFVIAVGAPFLPTLKPQVGEALDMINLKKGQTLLELGSGDGRVMVEAAKRGINSIGYELNPLLVVYSRVLTWRWRKNIKIVWANYWKVTLPKADGIFVFLLTPYMDKLDKKITKEAKRPVRLVSFAFNLPNKKPSTKRGGVFLYEYK